jgi:hypothetical protein
LPQQEQALPDQKLGMWLAVQPILDEIVAERAAQLDHWGDQSLPLGFGARELRVLSDHHRRLCDEANAEHKVTHRHVLLEELYEALAEYDPAKARDELIQVGACVIKAIQDIDRGATATAAG